MSKKKVAKRAFKTQGIGYRKIKRGQKKFSEGLAKNACYICVGKKNIKLGQIKDGKAFIGGILTDNGQCGIIRTKEELTRVIQQTEDYDKVFVQARNDESYEIVSKDARNVGKMLVISLPNSMTEEEEDEFVVGLMALVPNDCYKLAKMHYRSKSRQKHKHLHFEYTERSYVIGPVHEMFEYGENGSRSEFNKRVDAYIRDTLERFGYDVDSSWKWDELTQEYVSAMKKTKRVVSPRFFNEKIALELKKVDNDLRIDYNDIEMLKEIYEIACLYKDPVAMRWYEKKIEEYYAKNEVERIAMSIENHLYDFALEQQFENDDKNINVEDEDKENKINVLKIQNGEIERDETNEAQEYLQKMLDMYVDNRETYEIDTHSLGR